MTLFRKHSTPEKPQDQDRLISMLWDSVFNHLPTCLSIIEIKVNFILVFIGLVLGLMGVMVVRG